MDEIKELIETIITRLDSIETDVDEMKESILDAGNEASANSMDLSNLEERDWYHTKYIADNEADIKDLRNDLDELSNKFEEVNDMVDWHEENISENENEIAKLNMKLNE